MPTHDLTVSSEICATPETQNPPQTIPARITAVIEETNQFDFNYGGHGELPMRPDAHSFMLAELLDNERDSFWEGLTLEAAGMGPDGVPFFQVLSPVTQRRVKFSIPCWGVVAWVQGLPRVATSRVEPQESPTVIGFTRVNDEEPAEGWLKVERVTKWCKSALLVPGR